MVDVNYVTAAPEDVLRIRPDMLATGNPDGPSQTLGVAEGYDRAVAANRYAYQLRIGDELAANDAKLRSVGYSPPSLAQTFYHIPVVGAYLSDPSAATDFQTIMANSAQIAGPDERYAGASQRTYNERLAINDTSKMINEAKAKYPDLGLKTLDEIHGGVIDTLKRMQTSDPNGGWVEGLGGFFGAMGNVFSPSDPLAPLKTAALGLPFGIGASTLTRVISLGAIQAGLTVAEQVPRDQTRKLLGLPDPTASDMLYSAATSFVLGAGLGAAGEWMAGAAGRARLNDQFGWLSPAKRTAKYNAALNPPSKFAPYETPGAQPPPAPPAGPLPPDVTALAARPAGPTAFQRLGAGEPAVTPPPDLTSEGAPALPGLPPPARAPVKPADVPAVTQRALATTPTEPAPLTPTEQMEGSPLVYVPKDQRAGLAILDRWTTQASKARAAKDLDHATNQLQADGVAPQDLTAPSRPLSDMTTVMPDIREWQGAGAGQATDIVVPPEIKQWSSRHTDDLIARDPGKVYPDAADVVAREYDPVTWKRMDAILKSLNAAKDDLARIIRFHSKTAAGDKTALDEMVMLHEVNRQAARTPGGKARVAKELTETLDYHKSLSNTRAGGTRPVAPKHLDEASAVARVIDYEAKRDAVYPDIQRSYNASKGAYDLELKAREAIEKRFRPDASDWINSGWRWPKGHKRERDAPKSPYEVNLLKGPTTKELFAERELNLPQTEGAEVKPGEQPIDTATRVNQEKAEAKVDTTTEATYKQVGDFIKTLESVTTSMKIPEGTIPKGTIRTGNLGPYIVGFRSLTGQVKLIDGSIENVHGGGGTIFAGKDIIDPSAIAAFKEPGDTTWTNVIKPPSLPSGMTLPLIAKMQQAFELEGGNKTDLAGAWKEIESEQEAFKNFDRCAKVP